MHLPWSNVNISLDK